MHLDFHQTSSNAQITVITITYKDQEGFERTRRSVAQQSCNYDWVVIDGDPHNPAVNHLISTGEVKRGCAEKDNGIYDAMAKGLAMATTELVIFLNSGDTFPDSNSLPTALNLVSNEDVCYFAAEFRAGKSYRRIRKPRAPARSIWHSVPGNQQATIYRRSSLIAIGIPQEYKICGDYALASLLHVAGARARTSDHVLATFGLGGTSTIRIGRLCREAWIVQKRILRQSIFLRIASYIIRLAAASKTYLHFVLSK